MLFPNPEQDLPQFSHEVACFVRDYLPTFRNNFCRFSQAFKVQPTLPLSCELYAEKLYQGMFESVWEDAEQRLSDNIREFVLETLHAEQILLKSWLRMLNDYVDVLEANAGSTTLLLELAHWIDHLGIQLYHAYFRISMESTPQATTAATEQSDESLALLDHFPTTSGGQTPLQLRAVTQYRGVPILLRIDLLEKTDEGLIVGTDARHAAALSRAQRLTIATPDDATFMLAEVVSVDHAEHTVQVSPQSSRDTLVDRRELIRVEPQQATDVMLHHKGGHSRAVLIDIAENSASVYLRNTGVDIAHQITLEFSLPRIGEHPAHELSIAAQVASVRSDRRADPNAHVLVLDLVADEAIRSKIGNYVADRQTEILSEFRAVMDGAA